MLLFTWKRKSKHEQLQHQPKKKAKMRKNKPENTYPQMDGKQKEIEKRKKKKR